MLKMIKLGFLAITIVMFMVFQALAQGPSVNPNGFPSGDHYNLNLIGKKAQFNQDGLACTVDPLAYGNVVFVPEDGEGDIWLKSGKKATATTLQVTDPCVAVFDGNPAELNLPANGNGYWVFARALGKLELDSNGDPTRWMIIKPKLFTVSTEYTSGDETLLYLGWGDSTGFQTPQGYQVKRTKGKHPAVEISGLFAFNGLVCYGSDPATFGLTTGGYSLSDLCVKDTNADDIPDVIVGSPPCPEGSTEVQAYCASIQTDWIFNVADFVNYLMGVDNNGAKLVQIRFYKR